MDSGMVTNAKKNRVKTTETPFDGQITFLASTKTIFQINPTKHEVETLLKEYKTPYQWF